MKIAILTLPLHNNYGGILQVFALQKILTNMGHSVEVLHSSPIFDTTNWKDLPKRVVKKLLGRDIIIFREYRDRREDTTINKHLYDFRKRYISERTISVFTEIKETDYDCIVVGSDQVWRAPYFKTVWQTGIEDAFLSFTKGWSIRRIAYAASFGVDFWEQDAMETALSAEAIKQFDAVSVREKSAVSLLREYLKTNADFVLDPTMLLEQRDYVQLMEISNTPKSKGNLLNYILNPSKEKEELIGQIAKQRGLTPFSINSALVKNAAPVEERILPSVETWLRGFYDAEFVVTDSFHACVFSILFGKPFLAIGNATRGMTRFTSLLFTFCLEKNLITDVSQYDPDIDYSVTPKAKDVLNRMRNTSYEFLDKHVQ